VHLQIAVTQAIEVLEALNTFGYCFTYFVPNKWGVCENLAAFQARRFASGRPEAHRCATSEEYWLGTCPILIFPLVIAEYEGYAYNRLEAMRKGENRALEHTRMLALA
jgi:hypothetical protein